MHRLRPALLLSTALLAAPALAHHGWSEYDAGKTLTLTGTVEKIESVSPHTVIQLKTPEKAWTAVLAPPHRMTSRGLPEGTLKPGMPVTVEGYPHRKDAQEMRAERITVDGKTVELR
jgi:hypothetical protein